MKEPAHAGLAFSHLAAWLGDVSVGDFLENYLGKVPLARPGTAANAAALLNWQKLTAVLQATAPPPDVLVVARGQLLALPVPRDVDQTRSYFKRGVGLAMRHTQRCTAQLRSLADEFEREVGEAQVQVFATPSETHGFSWHYDDEDVFIAQIAGKKDYYFRANTVAGHVPASSSAFPSFKQETSQLQAATLIAGDFLYIPARWWHMAICHEDALSISVGVFPRRASRGS